MHDAKAEIQRRLAGVKAFLAGDAPPRLSESDTKANFIEPIIAALGWEGIGVVTREYYVRNSQEFIDYVMTGSGGLLLAIEAKPLQTQLTEKHAAQLIQYCAVEGIEWAALTNGRELQFFNSFLKPDLAAKRVLQLDLLAFNSDAEFDALFGQLWQLSRESMTTPSGVRTWLNQRRMDAALRAILLDPGSSTVRQLRTALTNAEINATSQDVTQWFRSHLSPPIAVLSPAQRQTLTGDNASMGTAPIGALDSGPRIQPEEREQPANANMEGSGRAGTAAQGSPLFQVLRQAVERRLPGTVWRATNDYVAAESEGDTFLAARVRQDHLILGLSLPPTINAQGLADNAGQFNWARMTKIASIHAEADVSPRLLDHIVAARSSAGRQTRTKTYHGVTIRDLIDAGYLQSGRELTLVGPGGREVTRARLRESGEIEWQGRPYRSPSDKAFAALLGRQSLNGWAHWRTGHQEGAEFLADIRARMQISGRHGVSEHHNDNAQSAENS